MLTDTEIKKAKARSKSFKLTDGNGLTLEVTPNGKKRWRYRYRVGGKENLFALGDYFPSISGETEDQSKERMAARRFTLAEARIERERCRALVLKTSSNYDNGVSISPSAPTAGIRFSMAPDPEELSRRRQQTTPGIFIYNCTRPHTN
jgi:hypothetical protein